MVCTRSRAARMSALGRRRRGSAAAIGAGAAGAGARPVILAIQSLEAHDGRRSDHAQGSAAQRKSARRAAVGQVQRPGGQLLILPVDPLQVLARLDHLALQGADGRRHGVQRLQLEGVDRVHRGVDVGERGLQLGQPDGGRGRLLLDLAPSCPAASPRCAGSGPTWWCSGR